MLSINLKGIPFISTLFLLLYSCNDTQQANINQNTSPKDTTIVNTIVDSAQLLLENLKKSYPDFILKLDSSVTDISKYSNVIYPDTTMCQSFKLNRNFLGKLDAVKATVLTHSSAAKNLFLQSGNLKLWVCNLPQKIKTGDTLIITGFVYDIFGNEKTLGYPAILTKVSLQH
jgi:hypothetical protein